MIDPGPLTGNSAFEVWGNRLREFAISLKLIDSPDVRAHHSPHGTALTLNVEQGGGTTTAPSGEIITAVVKDFGHDGVLYCRRITSLTSPTPGTELLQVAMPLSLRRAPWEGQAADFATGCTFEYVTEKVRRVKVQVSTGVYAYILQSIWPPYEVESISGDVTTHPPQGSIIRIAKPDGGTGVYLDAGNYIVAADDPDVVQQMLYVDLNVDARSWQSELNLYRICQNNLPKVGLFSAGQVQSTT